MFSFKDVQFEKKLRAGEVSPEQLKEHLVRYYSAFDLADALADYLIEENECVKNQIVLTAKQSQIIELLLSRIVREKHTGLGRKPKSKKYLDAREDINPDLFIKK